jgi:hypothetical protein
MARLPAHGSDIAQSSGKAFPAECARRVFSSGKMSVLNDLVGCHESLQACPERLKNGGIVADSEYNSYLTRPFGLGLNLVDKPILCHCFGISL